MTIQQLETEQSATYWPPVPLSLATLLSRYAGLLNRGSWRLIALYWVLVLPTASYLQLDWLQLTETVCGPGLYNCLTSTCFLWTSHLHPIQPVHSQGYTLISSTGCTCSWVGGQYVTLLYISSIKNLHERKYLHVTFLCLKLKICHQEKDLKMWKAVKVFKVWKAVKHFQMEKAVKYLKRWKAVKHFKMWKAVRVSRFGKQ